MNNDDPLLPTREGAEYCHYSERHFIRLRNQGEGPPYIKTRGKVLYRKSDLDSWLNAQRRVPVRGPVSEGAADG